MMVMMTRQLPATNKQAWWIASIARMYCAFILHSWRFAAGSAQQHFLFESNRLRPFVPAKAETQGCLLCSFCCPWVPAFAGTNG
jgi:hypothetical protein